MLEEKTEEHLDREEAAQRADKLEESKQLLKSLVRRITMQQAAEHIDKQVLYRAKCKFCLALWVSCKGEKSTMEDPFKSKLNMESKSIFRINENQYKRPDFGLHS